MDYETRREAKAKLVKALGDDWQVVGFKEDRSDIQTDYFEPATWSGIATRGTYVLCVDVKSYDVETKSGKPEMRYVPQLGPSCPRCKGTGKDPSCWTLIMAQKQPVQFNRDRLAIQHSRAQDVSSASVAMLKFDNGATIQCGHSNIASPAWFDDDGVMRCVACGGCGKTMLKPKVECAWTWPTFQANPKTCSWHVERDGKIIVCGAGLHSALTPPGATKLADRIGWPVEVDICKHHPFGTCSSCGHALDSNGMCMNPNDNE